MAEKKQPVVLVIRDGWGINPSGIEHAVEDGNATLIAQTPFHQHLFATYPQSTLSASGLDVGLPAGQMGNSEVGHLNLGAGRIVYQDLTRINLTISDGSFARQPELTQAFSQAKNHRLHLIGLVSDGGVHSHIDHLLALVDAAETAGIDDIMIHAITDGRDTSPTGGKNYLSKLEKHIAGGKAKIATVIGRYFAMDRDKRWDRTKLAWDAIVDGQGLSQKNQKPSEAVSNQYKEKITDEFMPAMIFDQPEQRRVSDGDVVVFFNFRADRARQLSQAFLYDDFENFATNGQPQVNFLTMTEYDESYTCPTIFPPSRLDEVLGEVVARAGLAQLRIAETEKYPHVTYFFNGGVEQPNTNEQREIIPSPKQLADGTPVKTYDQKPDMSAREVTAKVCEKLPENDLVILNFANPDMVGHTGSVEAAIFACETIDDCLRQVVEKTLSLGGKLLITADHGNCELMRNPDSSPHTAHTTNLVHLIYAADDAADYNLKNGILADIAPTLLQLLNLKKPAAMTGQSLLEKKPNN